MPQLDKRHMHRDGSIDFGYYRRRAVRERRLLVRILIARLAARRPRDPRARAPAEVIRGLAIGNSTFRNKRISRNAN